MSVQIGSVREAPRNARGEPPRMNAGRSSVPPPYIALTFVAIALGTLVATTVWTLVARVAPLALLHALAVGVFLMVPMGLLYQFVPVVAMSPLRFQRLPLLHAAIAAAGTLCIVIGFQNAAFGLVRMGGVLQLAGFGIEVVVLVATASRGKPPIPVRGALLSLVWLCLAMAIGIWMANVLTHGSPAGALIRYHAAFGLVGFFATIITAITFRLLRMFERVDHEPRTVLFTIGSAVVAIALASGSVLGGYFAAALAVLFGIELLLIARSRNPAYQRETFAYGACSAIAAIAAALCYIGGLAGPAIVITLWLFIGTAVVGYLQRIVPFIWWIARSHREGPRSIPTLGEMNHSVLGYFILVAWVMTGLVWLYRPASHIASEIALVACGALTVQLSRPFLLKKC
ncbi:MAG: hypothetical protein ACYDGM_07035 [Vulcanimicrobiaceae bacterium]